MTKPITHASQLSQDLHAAANVISNLGLAKCAFQDNQGRVCTQGALCLAISGVSSYPAQLLDAQQVRRYYSAQHTVHAWLSSNVAQWNDRRFTTKYKVIKTLRHIAKVCA